MSPPRVTRQLLLAIAALALAAKPPGSTAHEHPGVVADWKQRLATANEALRSSQWKKGARVADSVLGEMKQRIVSGDGSGGLLAVALLFRAIGEAGLGESHDARWDFGLAQVLYPPYSHVDLAPYGIAGAALDDWRYDGSSPANSDLAPRKADQAPVVPPRKLSGDAPHYPFGKRAACIHGPVNVQAIINETGRLEFPFLPSTTDPVFGLAALEALRDWRFAPARRAGEPVRVYYTLTVNFRLPSCP